jgi:hypothetical protein
MKIENLRFPSDYSLLKDGVSQSILTGFGCRRKMLFTINRLTQKGATWSQFGTAFHLMLENTYKRGIQNFNDKLFLKELGTFQREESKKSLTPAAVDKLSKEMQQLSIIFPLYIKNYAKDADKKFFKLEASFDYIYRNYCRFRGKIDGIYQDKKGLYWIIEHKTKSRIQESILEKRLQFDFQNLFYIIACREFFKISIAGVLYNIIRKPESDLKVGETLPAYKVRLHNDIVKKSEHYFKRYSLSYSKVQQDIFENELNQKLYDFKELIEGKHDVYRNEMCCEAPYPCSFLEACSSNSLADYEQKESLFSEVDAI